MKDRKDEHLKLAQRFFREEKGSHFDSLRFVHHSFPEMDWQDADISTSFAGLAMPQPFFINAMTGGTEKAKLINEKLALVAKETDLALAMGSFSVALKDPAVLDSFTIIRRVNPRGLVFANLGAEHTWQAAQKTVDLLEADALQIHCNVVQELIMPEGDRNFSYWLKNIGKIVEKITAPVIVKEVGFGMSRSTIKQLLDVGVKTIDVSGLGGTNFAKIESYRRQGSYDYLQDFGQSTVISLLEAQEFLHSTEILASGGIRNPLDIVKSLALGAKGVGIAGLFLNLILKGGVEKTIEAVNDWKDQIRSLMTLLGKKTVPDLQKTDLLILHDLKEWCLARGIPYRDLAKR